jgi:hypothetical protein
MTTCVNQEKKGYAGKAVSATLAGVLAVGMVPAAAFAEAAGDEVATEDASIDLLATSDATVVQGATVAEWKSGANITDSYLVSTTDTLAGAIPTKVTFGVTGLDDVAIAGNYAGETLKENTYYYMYVKLGETDDTSSYFSNVKYKEGNTETAVSGSLVSTKTTKLAAGSYAVVIFKTGSSQKSAKSNEGATYLSTAYKFTVAAGDLSQAEFFRYEEASTVNEDAIVFKGDNVTSAALADGSGAVGNYGLRIGKTVVANSQISSITLYPYTSDGGVSPTAATGTLYAGKYQAVIAPKAGSTYGSKNVTLDLTIEAYDISKANIVVPDIQTSGNVTYTIDGADSGSLYNNITCTTSGAAATVGEKTATFSYTGSDTNLKSSIIGAQTVKYNVVSALASSLKVQYLGGVSNADTWNSTGLTINKDSSTSAGDFDPTKLVVQYSTDSGSSYKTADYSKGEFTVEVLDKDHKTATLADVNTQGTWYVKVKLNAAALKYAVGEGSTTTVYQSDGSTTCGEMKVVYTNGSIANADVAFACGKTLITGTAYSSATEVGTYSGDDYAQKIAVTVKTTDSKTVVPAADYTVTYEKQDPTKAGKSDEWTKVTEAKDAGVYRITVKSDKYTISTDNKEVVYFEIAQKEIKAEKIATTVKVTSGQNPKDAVLYTGSEITPVFQYNENAEDSDLTALYKDIDASLIKVKITKFVDEAGNQYTGDKAPKVVKEAGEYTFTISDADANDNYTVTADNPLTLVVTSKKVFKDVPSTEWYAQSVYDANQAGYVYGYNGGDFFGPNDSIKRCDVAVILARMAGIYTDTDESDNETEFTSQFEDVASNAYYAKAVAWAAKTGITTGTSATTFEPERNITREEFATMLSRYAAIAEGGISADAKTDLAKYTDGKNVSSWAQTAVAWAIENNIMGVDTTVLNPTNTISRAEVAVMVVRYQPTTDTTISSRL